MTLSDMGLQGSGTPVITKTAGRAELCRLFASLGYQRGAEIGVWTGEFSEVICRSVPGVQLTCVDPWRAYKTYNEPKNNQHRLDDAYRQACERLTPFGCTIVRMTSLAAADQIPDGSLDFAYIDANHLYPFVLQDLEAWMPKIRSGGILAGHDFKDSKKTKFIEVVAAVEDFTRVRQIVPWFVLAGDKSPSYFWMVP